MQVTYYQKGYAHGSLMMRKTNPSMDQYNTGYRDGLSLAIQELPFESVMYMILSFPILILGYIGVAFQLIILTFVPWITVACILTIVVRFFMIRWMQAFLLNRQLDKLENKIRDILKDTEE